jgi:hypothetical protein
MSNWFDLVLLLLLTVAHAPLALHFALQLHKGRIPSTWIFAAMGIIVYYDLGIFCQFLGVEYSSAFFPPLQHCSEEELVAVVLLLLVCPYLLWCGSLAISRRDADQEEGRLISLPPAMRGLFTVLFLPVSLALAAFGTYALWGSPSVAEAKMQWVAYFGSAYIVFLVPMFLVGFLVRTNFSRERWGKVLLFLLIGCSVTSTLFLGQRTMTLLPMLLLMLFYFRVHLLRLVVAFGILAIISSTTLFFYKGYAVNSDLALKEGLVQVLNNDITRVTVLTQALRSSDLVGTSILPNPGQGYFYSLALYIPRRVLPEKGYSTTAYFTGMTSGEDVEYISWGLGVGFLEQIALNFGKLAILPGILVYGMFLGLLDRISVGAPSTIVGIRLGAVWMSGYDTSSILMYFGSMALFAFLLESLFVSRSRAESQAVGLHSFSLTDGMPGHKELLVVQR